MKRILFVDDDANLLEALRRGLRGCAGEWDMAFYADPRDALATSRSAAADVVVTDMQMPHLNGIELILAMREAAPNTRYILLTGTAELRSAIDAINRAEVFRFFTKPCSSEALIEGIRAALASSEAAGAELVGSGGDLGSAALDRLPIAVLVATESGRVLHMNRRAAVLCAAADGFMLDAGEICRTATPAETSRLLALVQDAASGGEGGALSVNRQSLLRPLSIVVSPLPRRGKEGCASLFILDPESHRLAEPAQLGVLLGLTPAEARLAHALASGMSLEEAAGFCGVTTNSARTYLKLIFTKTGVGRQAELVRLVLTQPTVQA